VVAELPGEMRLVVEAHLDGDLRDRLAIEQPPPRGIDAAPDHVAVRRDPEGAGEATDQMRRRHVEDAAGFGERQRL
jgi:hypothetical protein